MDGERSSEREDREREERGWLWDEPRLEKGSCLSQVSFLVIIGQPPTVPSNVGFLLCPQLSPRLPGVEHSGEKGEGKKAQPGAAQRILGS